MTGGFISESKNVSFHDKIRNYILIHYGLKSQVSTVVKKYIEEDMENSIVHKDILIHYLEIRIYIDERKKYLKILTGELNDLEKQVMKMIPSIDYTPVIIFDSLENKPKYL